jgi:hypothetical protein
MLSCVTNTRLADGVCGSGLMLVSAGGRPACRQQTAWLIALLGLHIINTQLATVTISVRLSQGH